MKYAYLVFLQIEKNHLIILGTTLNILILTSWKFYFHEIEWNENEIKQMQYNNKGKVELKETRAWA